MGQIIKSLMSHCYSVSVCKHSYGCNFDLILMKFCTVIWGPKSKIEFVWDKNLITPSPICSLFAPTPLFSGLRYPTVSFKLFPCWPPLLWQRILGQNWL